MSEHEPAMDLGLVRVLRGKEIVELFFRFDHPRVLILELFRAVIEIFLDRHQHIRSICCEFLDRHRFFRFNWLIAARNFD